MSLNATMVYRKVEYLMSYWLWEQEADSYANSTAANCSLFSRLGGRKRLV